MNKSPIKLLLLGLWLCFHLGIGVGFGQSLPLWGNLSPGPFEVGFSDTVVFKADEFFSWENQQMQKPFLMGIWYPVTGTEEKERMHYADYGAFHSHPDYQPIVAEMDNLSAKALQNYGICTNIKNWKSSKFGKKEQKLFAAIEGSEVFAVKGLPYPQQQFPCILYHHGAGGTWDENTVFCEYMASQGYVVISINFHWPFKNEQQSYLSIKYSSPAFNSYTDIHFVTDVIANLPFVDADNLIYAGHSWGAICAFFINGSAQNRFKFFLQFDTTLERHSRAWAEKQSPSSIVCGPITLRI